MAEPDLNHAAITENTKKKKHRIGTANSAYHTVFQTCILSFGIWNL